MSRNKKNDGKCDREDGPDWLDLYPDDII